MRKIARKLVYSIVSTLLLFASCKKSNNDTATQSSVTPLSRMTGVWSMHGTNKYRGSNVVDTINTDVTIWTVDDTTVVTRSFATSYSVNSVSTIQQNSSSIYVFGNYTYDKNKDSLQYYIYYPYSATHLELSLKSVSHTPFKNNTISTNTAKMAGTKEWHGSLKTVYIPPFYTGLPTVDTTYYNPITMRIDPLSDSLIMARMYYSNSNEVASYLFLRKTFHDSLKMIFTSHDNPRESITYYFATNSMFYFYSTGGTSPDIYKYYTP